MNLKVLNFQFKQFYSTYHFSLLNTSIRVIYKLPLINISHNIFKKETLFKLKVFIGELFCNTIITYEKFLLKNDILKIIINKLEKIEKNKKCDMKLEKLRLIEEEKKREMELEKLRLIEEEKKREIHLRIANRVSMELLIENDYLIKNRIIEKRNAPFEYKNPNSKKGPSKNNNKNLL